MRTTRWWATLLLLVWGVAGVWYIGHSVEHAEGSHAGSHLADLAGVVDLAASGGHGHSHPESFPVLAGGKAPNFEVSALLPSALALGVVPLSGLFWPGEANARAWQGARSGSAPRAPPIS